MASEPLQFSSLLTVYPVFYCGGAPSYAIFSNIVEITERRTVGGLVPKDVASEIKRDSNDVRALYYKLILIVGQYQSGKSRVLRELSDHWDTCVINLNLELAEKLLDAIPKKRPMIVSKLASSLVQADQPVYLIDNTEILFDPSFRLDPLRLLQSMSRNRLIICAWSGRYSKGNLIYAEKGHKEYRCYDRPDARVVPLENP